MSGKSKLAIAAAAALAAVPAAMVLAQSGGGENPGQGGVAGIATAAVHSVAADSPKAVAASGGAGAASSARLQYFLTRAQNVPAGRSGLKVGPLPKRCRPINGYYFIRGQLTTKVVSEGDSPYGKRQWAFYRNNPTGQTIKHVIYGVVCLRGVRVVH